MTHMATAAEIHTSIRVVVETQRGSAVFKPDFGVDWSEIVDAPVSEASALLVYHVTRALERWVPAIDVQAVEPVLEGSRLTVRVRWSAPGVGTGATVAGAA
jgi:phage baseplate assembly protein W